MYGGPKKSSFIVQQHLDGFITFLVVQDSYHPFNVSLEYLSQMCVQCMLFRDETEKEQIKVLFCSVGCPA